MTIEETREIITAYLNDLHDYLSHTIETRLEINGNNYRIEPDDAFYYPDRVLIFEYENNKRPVESISKYFWLLKRTNWLNENKKIKLLITINNNRPNEIRNDSVEILGNLLNHLYPNNFEFQFLNNIELTEENLLEKIGKMLIALRK
jgi:hypothetical protein